MQTGSVGAVRRHGKRASIVGDEDAMTAACAAPAHSSLARDRLQVGQRPVARRGGATTGAMPTVPQPSGHGAKYRRACVVAVQRVVG
jgi:hypothetical protein